MIRLGAFRLYGATLLCGLKLIMRGMAVDGIKTLIAPVGYWRFLPNSFVLHEFKKLPPNARILDVSSPKMMSIYLAGRNCSLVATDLDDERIFSRWKKIAEAQRLDNYTVEYQDATALAYPDQSFDMLYSISVIEHIPGRGDVAAMREFARVTKPGGVVVVEVPYRRKNAEVWRKTDTKGAPIPEPRFYERHYDAAMVDERLLHVAGQLLGNLRHQFQNLHRARRVNFVPCIAWLVIIPVQPREEEQYRHLFRRERRMVARPVSAVARIIELQIREMRRHAIQIGTQRAPCANPADIQLSVPYAADHVRVDHRHRFTER